MYDVLIKNGTVIDGNGEAAYHADVAVSGSRIVKVDKNGIDAPAAHTVDAEGLFVTPGFIDAHAHSDQYVLNDPLLFTRLEQGITTELAGQCGTGPAPSGLVGGYYEGKEYPDFVSFAKELEQTPLGPNLALFVPHGAVRAAVLGYERRAVTKDELAKMKKIVRDGLEYGALGMSSGLAYMPGSFSDQEEITKLAEDIAEFDATYVSHMRNQAEGLINSVKETIQVGRDTGCRIAISHHKTMGKPNWGQTKESVKLIDQAAEEGIRIIHDVYPYVANSTTLLNALPPSALDGGVEKIVERLNDPEFIKAVPDMIYNAKESWDNGVKNFGFDAYLISSAPNTPQFQGKFVSEIAEELGIGGLDAILYLLRENRTFVNVFTFNMSEEDMLRVLGDKYCAVGSDGGAYIRGKALSHPRVFGTFTRYLGRYVRDKQILSWEEAIRKITSWPATQYRLEGKGYIREGYDADITIFDPKTILDHSDFKNPLQKNEGIEYVFVAGKTAVYKNRVTGVRAGGYLKCGKRQHER